MSRISILVAGTFACLMSPTAPVLAADSLTLNEAVTIALGSDDPAVTQHEERAAALDDRAIADSQLPDPKVKLGLRNMPTNSFAFTQEPMTQVEVGVQQAFPAGNTRSLTRQKRTAEAYAARAGFRLEERNLVLQTRMAWLEAYYWTAAQDKINASRQAVGELLDITTATFASGHKSSQDVFRADLELALLDDRMAEAKGQLHAARATLARYVSYGNAARPLPDALPQLRSPPTLAILESLLPQHPAIAVSDARVDAESSDVALAEEKYKPQWMLDVGYGARGGGRPDFASAGITFSVPLFVGKRQDRSLSAARHQRQAERLARDAKLLDLQQYLTTTYADWQKLGDRITLYESAVLNRANGTTEAALSAYRNGVADFNDLISGRLSELNAQLTLLRLSVDRAKAQAHLLFLDGADHE